MRKIKLKTYPVIVIFIVIFGFFLMYFNVVNSPIKSKDDLAIEIKEGDSFYSIIDSLSKEKVIRGIPFIKLYILLADETIEVKPGSYILSSELSLKELISLLTTESTLGIVKFTVPEGYTIDEIGEKLESEGVCSKEDFIKSINNYDLPSYVKNNGNKKYNLEGYLFPDTYSLKKGMKPKDIVTIMIERFEEALNQVTSELGLDVKDLNVEEIITIASMIEREAVLDEERPIISSVIRNRLSQEMKLQIDATVIYALGDHTEVVLHSDLEVDSPYNTYKNYGLPVGPISNPGIPSIRAALKPAETDYIFYVLENESGSHYFTNDYEDFLNKQEELGY